MEWNKRKELYEKAIGLWGVINQKFMVMEETGELLNALAKTNRGRCSDEEVITELADVAILIEQMAVVFGVDKFFLEKERKLQRLKQRLESNYKLGNEQGSH